MHWSVERSFGGVGVDVTMVLCGVLVSKWA